jgi:peroxiredoxin
MVTPLNGAVLVARLFLFGVFTMAGAAKLLDLRGSRKALIDFGVPGGLAAPLGVLLPLAELGVAATLLFIKTVGLAGIAALVLLLVFMVGIFSNLTRGRTPDCHCFGQLHSAPAGWSTLIRNTLLAGVAGFIVWQGRDGMQLSVAGWIGDLTIAQRVGLLGGVAAFILLAVQGALLWQMLRQQGRILLRLDALEAHLTGNVADASAVPISGLALGTQAPAFRLDGLRGETMTLDVLVALGKPALLLFTNPNCGPCQGLLPDVSQWQREHATSLTIVVVSEGSAEDNRNKSAAAGISQVLLQQKREVAETYRAWGTPAAVLVRPDGRIGSPVAQGAEAIRTLVAQTISSALSPSLPAGLAQQASRKNGGNGSHPIAKLGERAPSLTLRDLNERTVSIKDFRGHQTLLLFWNPGCGYCQQMLSDLRDWEMARPPSAPKIVVVSTGTVEENRAMNLRSPVVLDQNFQAGAAFGANGTPMGVLLDAEGHIASDVAAGAQAVFALARSNANVQAD